ncbi:MAG TPA: PEP-CTERM sorting domain-containing protein [Fimbriiglobus sp.]|nr:PEP-CTERM sorting domain-containing protein [Fimbriiglobus sp.]
MTCRRFWCLAVVASVAAAGQLSTARAQFDITVNFTGGLTESQQATFSTAASFWETHIVGYRPAGVTLTGITINASGADLGGPGGTLGSAGPTSFSNQGGFRYATAGSMRFDTADLPNMEANGTLLSVIMHEMAHVMGFGTLWASNGLYSSGSGQYTGAGALAMWQTEFDRSGDTSVPVELAGGGGTANAHWNENTSGSGLTGITDPQGRDMRNELMTGWLNAPSFVSNTTIQQFFDLGYNVVPVPEPATILAIAAVGLVVRRLRRRRSGERPEPYRLVATAPTSREAATPSSAL